MLVLLVERQTIVQTSSYLGDKSEIVYVSHIPDIAQHYKYPISLWSIIFELLFQVIKFKNKSGYNKASKSTTDHLEKPNAVALGAKPTLPDIFLPDPNDANYDYDGFFPSSFILSEINYYYTHIVATFSFSSSNIW